jgi:hypothetical protein
MTLSRSFYRIALFASVIGLASGAEAQAGRQPFFGISGGWSATKGPRFEERGALTVDLLAGLSLRESRRISLVGVAAGGFTDPGGGDLSCALVLASNGHTYCAPVEPGYQYAGALLGLTTNTRPFAFSVMAGPAFVNSACACGRNPDARFGGNAFGVDMRAELSVRAGGPVWVTIAGSNLLIPGLAGGNCGCRG